MIIGLIPGAMKPYHAGHHYLVSQALKECDRVIILTTVKDRKDISGQNMKQAWETLILPKMLGVEISFVISPVGSIYKLLDSENINPTTNTYRIYGGTQDVNRYNMDKIRIKYPNSGARFTNVAAEESKNYQRGIGNSPVAKGEWIRNAITHMDFKKFENFLPNFLKPYAKEYLNILSKQ